MDDENISEKLKELARGKNRSATARIREIFDEIEVALSARARRKDVYKALINVGYEITFESFELAIYRIRKERKKRNIYTTEKQAIKNDTIVLTAYQRKESNEKSTPAATSNSHTTSGQILDVLRGDIDLTKFKND